MKDCVCYTIQKNGQVEHAVTQFPSLVAIRRLMIRMHAEEVVVSEQVKETVLNTDGVLLFIACAGGRSSPRACAKPVFLAAVLCELRRRFDGRHFLNNDEASRQVRADVSSWNSPLSVMCGLLLMMRYDHVRILRGAFQLLWHRDLVRMCFNSGVERQRYVFLVGLRFVL